MSEALDESARKFIAEYAKCFVDHIQFMIYEKAVIMYVETLKSELDYVLCIGLFDDPQSALNAALNSEEYRGHLASRKRLLEAIDRNPEWKANEEYLDTYKPPKGSSTSNPEIVKARCEGAIGYYHETNGTNHREYV